MNLLLILAFLFFFIITLLNLELALFLLIVLLPSYLLRFKIFFIPSTFLEISILLVFIVWFAKTTKFKLATWFKNRHTRLKYPFRVEIILLLIIAYIATYRAGFTWEALGILKAYFLEPILLFVLILNILPNKEGRKKIILALLLGAIGTALLAVIQKINALFIFTPSWAALESRRVISWFGYPNAVALFLAPSIFLFIAYLVNLIQKKSKSFTDKIIILLNIIGIILSFLAIIFTRSEGALIALLLTTVIILLILNQKTRLFIIITALISTYLLFGPLRTTLSEPIKDRIFLRTLSGEIRKQQWRETWQSFNGPAFFLGHGLSSYPRAIAPFHQEGIFFNRDKIENFHSILYGNATLRDKYWQPVEIYLYPHNIFLNFWSELGILGLILFIFIFIKFATISYQLFKHKRDYLALALLAVILTITIHGLVDVPYFKNDLSALFFIFLALLASLMTDYQITKKEENI